MQSLLWILAFACAGASKAAESSDLPGDSLQPVVAYQHPRSLARSAVYRVWANGQPVEVLQGGNADFVTFESDGPVELRIEATGLMAKATVRPLSRGVAFEINDRVMTFRIEKPQYLGVSVPGLIDLYIYANAIERNRPAKSDPGLHYFAAGQVYEIGDFKLKSGETFYIEGGAVVKGNLHAPKASHVRIAGRGILDGSYYNFAKKEEKRSIVFEESQGILIEDIIMIHPSSWMIVIGASRDAHIRRVKQIGSVMSTDGVDICGSRDVLIEQCFFRNDDDNIAIKSIARKGYLPWVGNIENVTVRDCVFYKGQPGNSMEIGFELSADRVSNIVFENIDVVTKGGDGAVFAMHNSDRALIENVRWENIRVESYWGKLIDLRVFKSRFTKDEERGQIRGVTFKNIRVNHPPGHNGYVVSLLGGASADKPVQGVVIEDLYLGETKVTTIEQLELLTRHCDEVIFK
ncbi:glycosyl hydrolase family 28 protein [Rariglobus hedericola]|uniref:Glycoside hydrolase n=1 Tax=Rariglobus hedericola TaxID=2597822 RepID=A0A556QL03_9BACT|nr:glycosyl hydrolase family 28 protein [Rariglobus hedericola]TSJ77291.1 hypothetical protein FPL22_14440 [Rariglobus hedericola]